MLLDKHKIFAHDDLKYQIVDMHQEWGGDVRIKAFSVKEQQSYIKFLESKPEDLDIGLYLVIHSCVDSEGSKIFCLEDLEMLKDRKSPESIFKLVNAILELNKQRADSVDQLAKNS